MWNARVFWLKYGVSWCSAAYSAAAPSALAHSPKGHSAAAQRALSMSLTAHSAAAHSALSQSPTTNGAAAHSATAQSAGARFSGKARLLSIDVAIQMPSFVMDQLL